jgi:enoyl-CoA hydratase/carnithine racemase
MVTETRVQADEATATPAVRLETNGPIGYIKIHKPKLNLYDRQFIVELNDAIDEIRFNNDIKVVVMMSELEKVFSAGADIHMLKASQPDFKSSFCLGRRRPWARSSVPLKSSWRLCMGTRSAVAWR